MWMNTQIIGLDTNTTTYYSPWFPRAADNAVFTAEVLQDTFGNGGIELEVFTKNTEDEGSGGSAVATLSALAGSFFEANVIGLKELVRFGITFKASSAGEGAVFRMLPPTWYDKAV